MDCGAREASEYERIVDACDSTRRCESTTQEVMEEYVAQCEKAIKTAKTANLPKTLLAKLQDPQGERENQAFQKSSSPQKTGGTEPTPSTKTSAASTTTTTIAKASE